MRKSFDRVYQREDSGKQIRVRVARLTDGDWDYEVTGKFHHICEDGECVDVDRIALLFLSD